MSDEPLTSKELAIYREGLADIPSIEIVEPLSALEASRREWGDRCRRLLATYDALAAERDRLREALEDLLEDTEHKDHGCHCSRGARAISR